MKINRYKLLVLVSFFLLLLDPVFSIGVDPIYIQRVYLLGMPASDYALMLMLITFMVNIKKITAFINKKILVLFGILFFYFLFQGVIINGATNFSIYNSDIRTLLWFYGGIAFAYALIKTDRIIQILKIIVIVSTILIVISSIYSIGYSEYMQGLTNDNERIGHPNIYILGAWIFLPIILLFNITPPKLSEKLIPLTSIILYFYFVAILSGTRSSTIICFAVFMLFTISLKIRTNNSTINIVKVKQGYKLFILILLFLTIIYSMFYLGEYRLGRFLTIFDSKALASDSRAFEFLSFFTQSNLQQLIFGRGLGGSISSPTYNGELTPTIHIGIMNFWMKMGILPFLLVSYILFIKIPIKYLRSFNSIKSNKGNYYQTANIVILSTLFPWIISLLISGGYGEINFLFVGFSMYFYGMVKTYGIHSILK